MLKIDFLEARREGLTCVLGRAGTRNTHARMACHLYNSLEIPKVLVHSVLDGLQEIKWSKEGEHLKCSLQQMEGVVIEPFEG